MDAVQASGGQSRVNESPGVFDEHEERDDAEDDAEDVVCGCHGDGAEAGGLEEWSSSAQVRPSRCELDPGGRRLQGRKIRASKQRMRGAVITYTLCGHLVLIPRTCALV